MCNVHIAYALVAFRYTVRYAHYQQKFYIRIVHHLSYLKKILSTSEQYETYPFRCDFLTLIMHNKQVEVDR